MLWLTNEQIPYPEFRIFNQKTVMNINVVHRKANSGFLLFSAFLPTTVSECICVCVCVSVVICICVCTCTHLCNYQPLSFFSFLSSLSHFYFNFSLLLCTQRWLCALSLTISRQEFFFKQWKLHIRYVSSEAISSPVTLLSSEKLLKFS